MKKWLLLALSSVSILTACGANVSESETINVESTEAVDVIESEIGLVTILLKDVDGEVVHGETIEVEEDVLVSIATEEAFEVESSGGFISVISGIEQSPDENIWWVFEINDEMVSVGAEEAVLKDGDTLVWKLVAF